MQINTFLIWKLTISKQKKKHKKEAAEVSFKAARLKLMPILQRNVL